MDIQKHIEENLPGYYQCNKVLRSDLLQRFADGELDETSKEYNLIKEEIESVRFLFNDKQIAKLIRQANDLELLEECE